MKTIMPVFLLMLVVAVLLTVAGCSDDDPVQVKDLPPTGPATPAELMAQFQTAYENMAVGNFLALLDPDYRMLLSAETIEAYPDLGPFLDLDEEERIHTRMFSGENLTDPGGHLVPGVESISVNVLNQITAWAPTDDELNFPDSQWALFQIGFMWYRGQQFSIYRVTGSVKIYIRAHENTGGGANPTFYLLAGVADLTRFTKGVENFSWGSVKGSFW